MKSSWLGWFLIAALAMVVTAPLSVPLFLNTPQPVASTRQAATDSDTAVLVIMTPHIESIRWEIERAFQDYWIRTRDQRPADAPKQVRIDWRSSGGTSDLRKQILSQFQALAAKGDDGENEGGGGEGIGVDLMFGGGDYEHNQLAKGVTVERNGQKVNLSVTVPVVWPQGMKQEVFPTLDIAGSPLVHAKDQWVGVVLSSFGIVFNRDVLKERGLPEPTTWSDLADRRYVDLIALADPSHSGSIAVTYETILRRLGWNDGWSLLQDIFANTRYFTSSASKVPLDVSSGQAAAGMCIDFYGRFQAGAVQAGRAGSVMGKVSGGGGVGYVDPPGMTAVTADPISLLRGSPAQQAAIKKGHSFRDGAANQFVLWLVTRDAQTLWQRRIGSDDGSPKQFELRRAPIRRDLYTPEEMARWTDRVEPYRIAKPLAKGMPSFYWLVAPVTQAMAIDVLDDLHAAYRTLDRLPEGSPQRQQALKLIRAMPEPLNLDWPDEELAGQWPAILDQPNHPRRSEVVQRLDAFTKMLSERYKDRDRLLEDRQRWTRFFAQNYRQAASITAP